MCFSWAACFKSVKASLPSPLSGIFRIWARAKSFFEFTSKSKYEKIIFFASIYTWIVKYSVIFTIILFYYNIIIFQLWSICLTYWKNAYEHSIIIALLSLFKNWHINKKLRMDHLHFFAHEINLLSKKKKRQIPTIRIVANWF